MWLGMDQAPGLYVVLDHFQINFDINVRSCLTVQSSTLIDLCNEVVLLC